MPSHALVTLCSGGFFEELSKLTHPLMSEYAKRIGSEFLVINKKKFKNLPVHFEKYQIAEILKMYERVLFVDTDIVIRPDSPNLFNLVPIEKVGVYIASLHSDCHNQSIQLIQNELGPIGWNEEYFNSGVMLLSKSHAALFDLSLGTFNGFFEQTQLNYNLQKLKLPIFDISYQFNHVQAVGIPVAECNSYFVHYAGPGHGTGPKYKQILGDYNDLI